MPPVVAGFGSVMRKYPNNIAIFINHGVATAHDLETLGETVRQRVLDHAGVSLEWEIKRMGEAGA